MDRDARRITLDETPAIPLDGLLLGWGATLPFAIFAAALWWGEPALAEAAAEAARLYAAALLIFFSGVRRGLSFRTEGGPALRQLATFALLFCAGLAALASAAQLALAIAAAALAGLAVEDARAARRGEAPLYFARLRPPQMAVAFALVSSCGLAI